MRTQVVKETTVQRVSASIRNRPPSLPGQEPVHSQPLSPCDDVQASIAKRAYELHVERGYRQGYALEDWLEAEQEILGER